MPTWGLENTRGDYVVSGWESTKNNNNDIDAVTQIKLWLMDPPDRHIPYAGWVQAEM